MKSKKYMSEFYDTPFADDIDVSAYDIRCFTANQEKANQATQKGLLTIPNWDWDPPQIWLLFNPVFIPNGPAVTERPDPKMHAYTVIARAFSAWVWRRRFQKWLALRRFLCQFHHRRVDWELGLLRPPSNL